MMNSVMKSSTKVGSRVPSACLKLDAGKRCHTIVRVVEGSRVPAAGLRDFLPNYHALVTITGSREGSKEVMEEIVPLMAMAELVRTTIRGRRGLVMTKPMQEDLCEIIVWHAKRCGASLRAVDGIYQPTEDPLKNTKSGQTVQRMNTKERSLIAKVQAGITVPRSTSSSIADSTMSSGSSSTASSKRFESELSRRYFILCSSCKETRGAVRAPSTAGGSPGVKCVAARRPLLVPNPWLDARLLWG